MLDGVEQCTDGVTRCGSAKIISSDMQVDLGAGDQPMAEQITNGHQANTGAYQVGCASVPQPMW